MVAASSVGLLVSGVEQCNERQAANVCCFVDGDGIVLGSGQPYQLQRVVATTKNGQSQGQELCAVGSRYNR